MDNAIIITVLCTFIGFLGGVLLSVFAILKKINKNENSLVAQSRDIKTLFRDTEAVGKQWETCIKLHQQTIAQITEVINQNNLLIQKVITD